MHSIDLNCDAGEGVGNEPELFPLISSCSIACGGHAGDADTMRRTISLAMDHGVAVGAHPSYPDRDRFGRVSLKIDPTVLRESLELQLHTFGDILTRLGAPLHHIKAHGALYNDLAPGGSLATLYLEVLEPFREGVLLYAPCGAEFVSLAESRGFAVWEEAFADRAYEPDGSLVARTKPGAVVTAPEAVFEQLKEMVLHGRVRCVDGTFYPLQPRTICIHGDTPNASGILQHLAYALEKESIQIRK